MGGNVEDYYDNQDWGAPLPRNTRTIGGFERLHDVAATTNSGLLTQAAPDPVEEAKRIKGLYEMASKAHEPYTERELRDAALEMLREKRCSLWPATGFIIDSSKSDDEMNKPIDWLMAELLPILKKVEEKRGQN